MVLSPGTRTMSLWRAALWTRTATANASRWAYNVLLASVVGTPRLEYKEIKLPLDTEKLIELLFRCGRAVARILLGTALASLGETGRGYRGRWHITSSARASAACRRLVLGGRAGVYPNIGSPSLSD